VTSLPDLPGVLSAEQVAATADAIASLQLRSGQIPWHRGGHADPWNHTEAAIALLVGGRRADAERAFEWLRRVQSSDGSWANYYVGEAVEDPRRDTNVIAYAATGVWHHWVVTGDRGFADALWPTVERAIDFVLRLQQPGGEVLWCVEPDGSPGRFALLTGSSSIYFSLRCAVALAGLLGHERPDWEVAALRLGAAVAFGEDRFEPKRRWAMDWYYPVLCGAFDSERARGLARIEDRWEEFVMAGLGCRCVADRPWITAAETAELVLSLDAVGRPGLARQVLTWSQYLRLPDGSYWTGMVHPQEDTFPTEERSSYTAAAQLLAADALGGFTRAGGLFRGEGVPDFSLAEGVAPELER
jgi:hypothetical protein